MIIYFPTLWIFTFNICLVWITISMPGNIHALCLPYINNAFPVWLWFMCICALQQTMVTQMSCPVMNSRVMTAEEYFNPSHNNRDIGQPCHLTTKTQRCLHISHLSLLSHMLFVIIIILCLCSGKDSKPREWVRGKSSVKIQVVSYWYNNYETRSSFAQTSLLPCGV